MGILDAYYTARREQSEDWITKGSSEFSESSTLDFEYLKVTMFDYSKTPPEYTVVTKCDPEDTAKKIMEVI